MATVPRQELEQILSKVGFEQILALYSDAQIEQKVRELVLPLNITSLSEAKRKFAEITGWSIYMVLPDSTDHERLWSLFDTYIRQLR
jgi:hypothetical protein